MARQFLNSLPRMGVSAEMSGALARLSETTGAPVAWHVRDALTAYLIEAGLLLDGSVPPPEPAGRRVFNQSDKKEN